MLNSSSLYAYTMLKINKLVNYVNIPLSLKLDNLSVLWRECESAIKSTQQCLYPHCLPLEGGQCKINPELAREKGRIETMNFSCCASTSAKCTCVTPLLLGDWESGAENLRWWARGGFLGISSAARAFTCLPS